MFVGGVSTHQLYQNTLNYAVNKSDKQVQSSSGVIVLQRLLVLVSCWGRGPVAGVR